MTDIFDDEFETYIGDLNTSNPENAVLRRSKGLMARSRKLAGPRRDMSVREIGGALVQGFKAIPGAATAGVAEGVVGLPGDIESLVRGLVSMASRPENKGRLEALVEGMEKETILPTIDEVQKFIDENITDFGDSPYRTLGQIAAPASYVKPLKEGVKAVKQISGVASAMEGTKE